MGAERMKDRKNSNSGRADPGNALWWSPTSWIQNWVESSLSLASSAYAMKKQWDELVAAKQAERDAQRLAAQYESDSSASEYATPHLIPNVIVTSSPLPPTSKS